MKLNITKFFIVLFSFLIFVLLFFNRLKNVTYDYLTDKKFLAYCNQNYEQTYEFKVSHESLDDSDLEYWQNMQTFTPFSVVYSYNLHLSVLTPNDVVVPLSYDNVQVSYKGQTLFYDKYDKYDGFLFCSFKSLDFVNNTFYFQNGNKKPSDFNPSNFQHAPYFACLKIVSSHDLCAENISYVGTYTEPSIRHSSLDPYYTGTYKKVDVPFLYSEHNILSIKNLTVFLSFFILIFLLYLRFIKR
jgi:hypothetical protein